MKAPVTSPRSAIRALVVFALVAEAVYVGLFSWRFPLPRLYATLPPVDYAKLTDYRLADAALLLVAYVVLVGGLTYILRRGPLPHTRGVLAVLFTAAFLFGFTLLWVYPVFAIDMLFYALHARLWLLYGANPLIVPPSRFPGDPWIALKGEWVNAPSAYGPLWEVTALGVGWITGPHNMLGMLMGVKTIAFLAYLADVVLVALIAAQLWPQQWASRAMYFAWNPLVLLELVGNGHNDGLMLLFVLLAVWCLVKGWEMRAHGALALAVLVKVTPVFLWPFLWLWGVTQRPNWRERTLYTLRVAGVVAVTLAVFALFLWPNPGAWYAFHEAETAGRSPQALAILAAFAAHVPHAYTRTQRVFQGLFLLIYGGILFSLLRRGLRAQTAASTGPKAWKVIGQAWWWTLVGLVGVFASNWRPWYTTWFLALAALLDEESIQRAALALSFTALTGDVFWTNLSWRWYEQLSRLAAHVIGVLWVFGVPALVYLWHRQRQPRPTKATL